MGSLGCCWCWVIQPLATSISVGGGDHAGEDGQLEDDEGCDADDSRGRKSMKWRRCRDSRGTSAQPRGLGLLALAGEGSGWV